MNLKLDTAVPSGRGVRRFALTELAVWASLYPAYLAVRGSAIGEQDTAVKHASQLIDVERALSVAHEQALQSFVGDEAEFFSTYYLLGFGPLIAGFLVWLGVRHRALYREMRTLLMVSLGIAVVFYVRYPTAPPRLVPSLGMSDTVGLSGHDTGSVGGIRFNPYAAMPSLHVGWSLLVALIGVRATRRCLVRALFLIHPLAMAIAVTATGNHYFVDSLAGAGVAVLAVGVVAGARRVRPAITPMRRHRPDGKLIA